MLNVADVEPAGILITGFRSNFLNLSSSESYAYNVPETSSNDLTLLNSASSAAPSTYP